MKKVYLLLTLSLLTIIAIVPGCLNLSQDKDALFQTSMFSVLSEGDYEGDLTYGELKRHGDFGIGTFDRLDGEMVALDGEFYQIKADGKAYRVAESMKTPFAIVTFFESDKTIALDKALSYEQIMQYIDGVLPTKNIFYAIKIDGAFEYVKARSVPAQNRPYQPLDVALEGQTVFEFHDVNGTLVGFWCPSYMQGINVPGYHLHFTTSDGKAGGHLLECRIRSARAEIDYTPNFLMDLPKNQEFYNLNLEAK